MHVDFRRLTLHIGLHKTASTHLQSTVFPNFESVIYPKKQHFHDVLREFANPEKTHCSVLWSSEGLSGSPFHSRYGAQRTELLNILANSFPGSKLFLVLRNPTELIPSLYRQYIHMGGLTTFNEWWNQIDSGAYCFSSLVDHVMMLPFAHVEIMDFDEMITDPANTIERLEGLLESRFTGLPEDVFKRRDANIGVRRCGARTLRYLNRYRRTKLNPSGIKGTEHKLLKMMRINPRFAIQKGPLKFLNSIGEDVIKEVDIGNLHEIYDSDWAITKEKLLRIRQRG